jgi:hypothetical protein
MTLRKVLLGLSVALAAAGCSSGDDDPAAAATTSAPAASASTATSTAPTPTPTPALPVGCESLLPFTDLDQALGRPLFGETRFVQGVAQPSIGRTGRITCYYGLAKGGRGAAPVEVGASTYKDAESATQRVTATIAAGRSSGTTSETQATIAGQPATVLGSKTGFTVVVAQGDRTIAVTVLRTLRGQPNRAVVAVAEKVAANWTQ